jgi:MFS family permease
MGSDADLTAVLSLPPYRAYALSRAASGTATALLQTIIAWQVFAISGSALALGLLGLVRFLPALALSLVGGAVVDAYDRRRILQLAQLAPLGVTLVILAALAADRVSVGLLYAMVFVIGLASSFENPARQALLPTIIPRPLFTRAVTTNSTLQSLAAVTGPTLGGLLIAWAGVGPAYVVHGLLVATSIGALATLHLPAAVRATRPGLRLDAIRAGLAFVWQHPVLLGAMTLDMFAVIFGGAKALLPVYAVDILHANATGYGVLSASLEAGSLVMALILVVLPTPTETGRTLLLSVVAFGLATIVFGLSASLPLSIVAYAAVGMADQVSMVMRQNTIQLGTPDHLRGRVTAVSSLFVGASNQLGGLESGLVAAATSAVFAVVSGGVACLVVVALVAWWLPALRSYRAVSAG